VRQTAGRASVATLRQADRPARGISSARARAPNRHPLAIPLVTGLIAAGYRIADVTSRRLTLRDTDAIRVIVDCSRRDVFKHIFMIVMIFLSSNIRGNTYAAVFPGLPGCALVCKTN